MDVKSLIIGKWWAARSLTQFIWHLRNWKEIWLAYRSQLPMPDLLLRSGMVISHTSVEAPALLFREIFAQQLYTRGFYRPRPNDIVLDFGANIGMFALFLQQQAPGIRVHCFEPTTPARNMLRTNLTQNRLSDSCIIHPLAIGAEGGRLRICLNSDSLKSSAFIEETDKVEEVETVGLAGALRCSGNPSEVALLKIDIEGSELELSQASASDWLPVRRVIAECHDGIRPGCHVALRNSLVRNGFSILRERFADGGRLSFVYAVRR
jgi:FkbM family methyltransferase